MSRVKVEFETDDKITKLIEMASITFLLSLGDATGDKALTIIGIRLTEQLMSTFEYNDIEELKRVLATIGGTDAIETFKKHR